MAARPKTRETPAPALDRAAVRRFHLGAPGAPVGGVPAGAVPAALQALRGAAAAAAPADPLALLRRTLAESRRAAREAFARQARELAAQAELLLEAERQKTPEGRDPGRLGSAMGSLSGRFVDASALSGVLGERRGGVPLPPARIRDLQEALELLREAAGGPSGAVPGSGPVLVHNGTLPRLVAPLEVADGPTASDSPGPPAGSFDAWTTLESSDPCRVAAEVFDRAAEGTARLLRAARRVRLEAAGEYDPARHDALLGADGGPAALDWQAFSPAELALVPPVVTLESADQLAERGMVSLARLLSSGRPVQVVVVADPAASPGGAAEGEPLAGYRLEPAYLGLALREAFVQQGAITRPEDLAAGFRRAVAGSRAGLHVVDAAPPDVPGLAPAAVAGAAVDGRAHPVFRYDPEAGATWPDRMTLGENPAPREDWPEAGGAGPFTFADYALLAPALGPCFLAVPAGLAEDDDLVTVPEWLGLSPEEALQKVPAVRAADRDGRPLRLAVSRPLALACRDRLGFWRTLQELSGVRSEHVLRAEERLREEIDARIEAERRGLETEHAAALERVRREAVEDVVSRLTAGLLGLDPAWLAPAGPEAALGAFAGRDADRVAAELLEMVGAAEAEKPPGDGHPQSEDIDRLAGELRTLLGDLEGNGAGAAAVPGGSDPS
ncbi:MAG TPA: hypothetical protein VF150_10020 [Thermoanaerobaculia bacterium]